MKKRPISFTAEVLFVGFIVTKWLGTAFASWSWWWLLLPMVPWIGFIVKRFGL